MNRSPKLSPPGPAIKAAQIDGARYLSHRAAGVTYSAKLAMKAHTAWKAKADKPTPLGINSREVISFQEQVLILDNDPSAGSPTETLLRLLLPLNDKVWTASRGIAAGEPTALPQSGGLTGSFNR